MKTTRRAFLVGGGAIAVTVLGQRQSSSSTPIATTPSRLTAKPASPYIAQQNREINLYSARHYDTDSALYESFTRSTGIKVNLVEAKAEELIERIKSEGPNSPADVLITVDAGNLWQAAEADLFAPVRSKTLEDLVPAPLRDPDGLWFGLSQRARVIMYNKARVNPSQLSTYEALTDSQWRGKILIRSSSNVYNQSLVGSLIAANGLEATEAWARGMVANFARPPQGNDTAQIKAVAAGVGDLAIANHYYLVRLAKSDKRDDQQVAEQVRMFFPNQTGSGARGRGTHINISGGGVVKTSRNKEGAIKFLEHLVSKEAQEIFAKGNNEYPVRDDVPMDDVLKSYGTFKRDRTSAKIFGQNNAEALKLMDRAGWK